MNVVGLPATMTPGSTADARRAGYWAAAVVLLAVVPFVLPNEFRLYTLIVATTYLMAAIGLNVAVGSAGLLTLGHSAFALLGSYGVAIGVGKIGLPTPAAFVVSLAVCAVVGAITAVPALRLGQWAVAIMTLLYLPALVAFVLHFDGLTGGGSGLFEGRSDLSLTAIWYLTAGAALVVWVLVRNLTDSPLGRAWRLTRRSTHLASALGIETTRVQLSAFVLAAVCAGLAGSFGPVLNGFTSPELYSIDFAVLILAMVVIGGEGTSAGPIVGVALIAGIPVVFSETIASGGRTSDLVYGAILIAVVLTMPGGIVGTARRIATRTRSHSRADPVRSPAEPSSDDLAVDVVAALPDDLGSAGRSLQVVDVFVSVGGVRAVDGASLTVDPGTVHGIIGPNGAGKTTLLNAISGFIGSTGSVQIGGVELPQRPAQRSSAGVSRTFQLPILLDDATALDNVVAGLDSGRRVSHLGYALRLPSARREAARVRREAGAWLAGVGLAAAAGVPAGALTSGQKRQLEVARALAAKAEVILMDEPAAGLSDDEIRRLARLIRAATGRGLSMVIVEHHADLMMELCDRITVLDMGQVIASGTPDEIRSDPRVIAAYLGDELV